MESLAVRKAAVEFKSLGGLANKIKLAYTMLTLPAWNKYVQCFLLDVANFDQFTYNWVYLVVLYLKWGKW